MEFAPPGTYKDQRYWEAYLIIRLKSPSGTCTEMKCRAEYMHGTWYGDAVRYACDKDQLQIILDTWNFYLSQLTLDDNAPRVIEIEVGA